ncbi:MAG: hypothetical protein WCG83_01310 [Candidatus Peregrinibacteria bacterium]
MGDENTIDFREPFPSNEDFGEDVTFIFRDRAAELERKKRETREAPARERQQNAQRYNAIMDALSMLD